MWPFSRNQKIVKANVKLVKKQTSASVIDDDVADVMIDLDKKNVIKIKPKHRIFTLRNISLVFATTLMVCLIIGGLLAYDRWQNYIATANAQSAIAVANGEVPDVTQCLNILDPSCWTAAFKPELLKDNNKTTVLIIGSDARNNSEFIGNTDTMILATYDYTTNQAELISVPRDLYAPYQYKDNGPTYYAKINSIDAAGSLYAPDKNGTRVLENTLQKITGLKIEYAVVIRFTALTNGVDALGGIDVNVPIDHTDVYPASELPKDLQASCRVPHPVRPQDAFLRGYCLFSFKKGLQHMDGRTALIYARMRELSTDFDRSRRQQEVLDAIKNKILSDKSSLIDKASMLYDVYNGIKQYVDVKFDLNVETILAGLNVAETYQNQGTPAKIILDPSFAGGGVIIKGDGTNFNFADYTFKQVQKKLAIISTYIEYYKETPNMYVVNATGSTLPKTNPIMQIKNAGMWFMKLTLVTGKSNGKYGIQIIDYTNGQKNLSINKLKKDFGTDADITVITATPDSGLKATHGEDIGVFIYPNRPADTAVPTNTIAPSATP